MRKYGSPLNNIRVASPCSANWDEMYGNDRKRFCGACKLNVYNLSGMTRVEAEDLIRQSEGRLCVRFYSRADGSVITQDCPVGWARVKQRAKSVVTAVFSVLLGLFSGIFFVSMFSKQEPRATMGDMVVRPITPDTPQPMMGAIAVNTASDPPPNYTMGNVSTIQGKIARR